MPMLLSTGSRCSGIGWGLGGMARVMNQERTKRTVMRRYEPAAPQASNAKPMIAGPITEQLIHVLLIQEVAFTVRCFGTTWASKAVLAGSAKPRATPARKITA